MIELTVEQKRAVNYGLQKYGYEKLLVLHEQCIADGCEWLSVKLSPLNEVPYLDLADYLSRFNHEENAKKNKIILSEEHAGILDRLISQGYEKEDIVHIQSKRGWHGTTTKNLLDLTLDEVCTALYVGYKIEKTKEEKVLDLCKRVFEDAMTGYWYKRGIIETLNTLDIKIKGINE